ncbi:unnamed protein product [Arabis nemorensis]|uniref:Peptidase C1A papain C-terminal domain-containing protein n=1 Tax=Arabis nemorensis TaxID=586526 RepID=A0A565C4B3_9BRAS|nr:unnamed protein product [Arabis nemorensis]
MNRASDYTFKTGGLMREEDYPYTGNDGGTCKLDKSKIVSLRCVKLQCFRIVLAVAINAEYMQTCLVCPYICSRRLNHGVLLARLGWVCSGRQGLKKNRIGSLKNSWGENGFYKIYM